MNNRSGICSWVFGHHDYQKIAQYVAQAGFDGVELLTDIEKHDPTRIREVFARQNLRIFSMTPDNVDIAHGDDGERERAIDYYEKLIDFAAILNAPAITCHEYVGRTQAHDCRESEWARIGDACQRITVAAREKNIQVVFEPLNKGLVSAVTDCEKGMKLVRQIASPFFNLVLDTFHMHKEEPDACAAIKNCGQHLKLFQIADSNRKGMGLGDIDFAAQFKTLGEIGYRGPLMIECAAGIKGPSLQDQAVDFHELDHSIKASIAWLKEHAALL